jgi:hypothetical protein
VEQTLILLSEELVHELSVLLRGHIGEEVGEGLYCEQAYVFVVAGEEDGCVLCEEFIDGVGDLVVEGLHEDAEGVEEVAEDDLVEIGSDDEGYACHHLLQAFGQPEGDGLVAGVLDDRLQERPGIFVLEVAEQYAVYFVGVVDDALPAQHQFLYLADP